MNPLHIYDRLFAAYGPQGWWPVTNGRHDPRVEIAVGAILTQMVAWKNVEQAIARLVTKNTMSLEALRSIPLPELEELIRPSGFYKQKAKKLKAFAASADFDRFAELPGAGLRTTLLQIRGVGEETADSIMLYAFERPSFVIDTYTKRLCEAEGVRFQKYGEYKTFFEKNLPDSVPLWNEYHALIVAWGKSKANKNEARLL